MILLDSILKYHLSMMEMEHKVKSMRRWSIIYIYISWANYVLFIMIHLAEVYNTE